MSAFDERTLKERAAQEYAFQKIKAQAQKLKPLPLVISPPKGYYISGADYQKYKTEALAYNKKLLQYKRDINQAAKDVIANRTSLREYERLSRNYIQQMKAQAPQRAAFKEYIEEYGPQTTGPPEITPSQRATQTSKLPIPSISPGLRITEQTQQAGKRYATSVLTNLEAPFQAVTGPMAEASRALESLSHDVYKTDKGYQQQALYGAQTQPIRGFEEQLRVKAKPMPALGTAAYIGSVGVDVARTGFDVATFSVRPGLMVESASGLIRLGIDPETQIEFGKQAAADPFRFASKLVGGALLGPQLKAAPAKLQSAGLKWWSKREFDRLGLDEKLFTQFEREMLLDFPEETVDYVSTQRLFKRKELVSDKGKIPYFLETSPELEKLLSEPQKDTWTPAQVSKEIESYYALPYSEKGGAILVKGSAGMKPFIFKDVQVTTKEPVSGQMSVTVPKVPSVTKTVTKSSFFETSMSQESIFYIPSVDLRSTLLTSPQVTIPNLFPSMVDFSLASLTKSLSVSMQTGKQKQVTEQAVKQITVPKILFKEITVPQIKMSQVVVPGMSQFSAPKPTQVQTPVSVQIQTPSVTQVQTPIQVSIQIPKVTQIQVPKQITIPIPAVPQITMPDYTVKPLLYVPEPEKKKKKRKVSKRRAIYERRVDPLKITFPEIKLPKVPKF